MPTATQQPRPTYDPVAAFNAEIARIVGEADARKHRIAIKNVEKRIASLKFAPAGMHVTHLIDGLCELQKSLDRLQAKVAA